MTTLKANETDHEKYDPEPKPSNRRTQVGPVTYRTIVLIAILILWEALARIGFIDELFLSMPSSIIWSGLTLWSTPQAVDALHTTLTSIAVAFVWGTLLGMIVGIVIGLQQLMRRAYFPIIMILLGIPKSVFLPVFVLLFGLGATPAIVFGTLLAFVHVVVNVVGGVDLIEVNHLRVARAFRANRIDRLIHVIIPAAGPGLFTAVWHGLRNAFVGVVVAELFASSGGVGSLVQVYSNNFQMAEVFGLVGVVSLAIIIIGTVWGRIELRLTRWRKEPFA